MGDDDIDEHLSAYIRWQEDHLNQLIDERISPGPVRFINSDPCVPIDLAAERFRMRGGDDTDVRTSVVMSLVGVISYMKKNGFDQRQVAPLQFLLDRLKQLSDGHRHQLFAVRVEGRPRITWQQELARFSIIEACTVKRGLVSPSKDRAVVDAAIAQRAVESGIWKIAGGKLAGGRQRSPKSSQIEGWRRNARSLKSKNLGVAADFIRLSVLKSMQLGVTEEQIIHDLLDPAGRL